MKLLFDNCVPKPLRRQLGVHEVKTAYECGWPALSNGELLKAAAAEAFDVFITVDQNLRYQQNLSTLPLPVIVLVSRSMDVDALSLCLPHIEEALARITESRRNNANVLVRIGAEGLLP